MRFASLDRLFCLSFLVQIACSAGSPDDADPSNVNVMNDRGVGGGRSSTSESGEETPSPAPIDIPDCWASAAEGAETRTSTFVDALGTVTAKVTGAPCERAFQIASTAELRASLEKERTPSNPYLHPNPRTVFEDPAGPQVFSQSPLFDGLFALALEEARENSVEQISDGAFGAGTPLACPSGGCFETGRKWAYVWTRDTAYAVDLALSWFDPLRSKNSLEFKLSERRGGGDRQIVQDTGSGGSYPISSDRVVWSLGAEALLNHLTQSEYESFAPRVFEALKNTINHDRAVVFDEQDGLYRGEQSFLDWRQQTYPYWTAADTGHIGMGKALSTNVTHFRALSLAAQLAKEFGAAEEASRFSSWAFSLMTAIHSKFYQPSGGTYASCVATSLDGSTTRQADLLGTSLALLSGVTPESEWERVIATYPVVPAGAPVIWPQEQDVPIYHNRAIWPFVTAYAARAAKKAGHALGAEHSILSLYRGAALNLSNMENLEMTSGAAYFEAGAMSGPVVNSERQLWSVAGYLSAVVDVMFGLQVSRQSLQIVPLITGKMRQEMLAGSSEVSLNSFPLRGRTITIVLRFPGVEHDGAYEVESLAHNGQQLKDRVEIAFADLTEKNLVEVRMRPAASSSPTLHRVAADASFQSHFSPRDPRISEVSLEGGKIRLELDPNYENPADIRYEILRDGEVADSDISGGSVSWTDPNSSSTSPSHCYSVRTYYVASGNRSRHAAPKCYFGPSGERVSVFGAAALSVKGGAGETSNGAYHYSGWGESAHTMELVSFTPSVSGRYLLQTKFANGSGGHDTGITCAVKRIEVSSDESAVGGGYLVMPHTGDWSNWTDSNVVPVELKAGVSYSIRIFEDERAVNMSEFEHFNRYTGGAGGQDGRHNFVDIAELKILRMAP